MIPHHTLTGKIRQWITRSHPAALSDGELLDRFRFHGDEPSFQALIERHGPMVLRVCQRCLHDWQEAENAFQASFLVLARKADAIARRDSLAAWLHGVARRTALRARAVAAQRREREKHATPPSESKRDDVSWREMCSLLDEEVQRLPDKYRQPVVLYYLEGRTSQVAAQQLGWSLRTFQRRLEEARALLRSRLLRRGVELTALLLAADVAASPVPAQLVKNTVAGIAGSVSAGPTTCLLSAEVVALANGAVRGLGIGFGRLAALVLVCAGLLGAGSLLLGRSGKESPQPAVDEPAARLVAQGPVAQPAAEADPLPAGAVARMGSLRLRHASHVGLLDFTSDSKELITASPVTGTSYLWDAATGKKQRTFGPKDYKYTQSVGYLLSPDHRLLAVIGGQDQAFRVWDVAAGKELCQFPALTRPTVFSPDGRTLVVVDGKNLKMTLHDSATAKETSQLSINPKALGFSPDSRQIVTWAGKGDAAQLWDAATGKLLRDFGNKDARGPMDYTDSLVFLDSGLSSLSDLSGKYKDIRDAVAIMPAQQAVAQLAFVDKGKLLVLMRYTNWGLGGGTVTGWEVATGKEVYKFQVPQLRGFGIKGRNTYWAMSADQQVLAVPTRDGLIQLFDMATGKEFRQVKEPESEAGTLSGDGRLLVVQAFDKNRSYLRLWETRSGKELWRVESTASALVFSPDGQRLAGMGAPNVVQLWDTASGKNIAGSGHRGDIRTLGLSADGQILTTLGSDNAVCRWELRSGREISRLQLPYGPSSPFGGRSNGAARLSDDGGTIGHSPADQVELLDPATGRVRCRIDLRQEGGPIMVGGGAPPANYILSPDGKRLLARGPNEVIRFYETATGKQSGQVNERRPAVLDAAKSGPSGDMKLSADGAVLATSWANYRNDLAIGYLIHVWDPRNGATLGHIGFEPKRRINGFALVPDGRSVLLFTQDKNNYAGNHNVSLWEVATGTERMHLDAIVGSASVSPDGRVLATGGTDSVIRLWSVDSGQELGQLTGHTGRISTLTFLSDGRHLVSGSEDTTALVWDLALLLAKLQRPEPPLDDKQLEALWTDLAAKDGAKAWRALGTLTASSKQAVPWLQRQVPPAKGPEAERLRQLIVDLESGQFAVRDKASMELTQLGELAEAALRKRLEGTPPLETRQRIERVLEKLAGGQPPSADAVRQFRAVEILERCGTADARKALESLARGAEGARLTREAKASLDRLARGRGMP